MVFNQKINNEFLNASFNIFIMNPQDLIIDRLQEQNARLKRDIEFDAQHRNILNLQRHSNTPITQHNYYSPNIQNMTPKDNNNNELNNWSSKQKKNIHNKQQNGKDLSKQAINTVYKFIDKNKMGHLIQHNANEFDNWLRQDATQNSYKIIKIMQEGEQRFFEFLLSKNIFGDSEPESNEEIKINKRKRKYIDQESNHNYKGKKYSDKETNYNHKVKNYFQKKQKNHQVNLIPTKFDLAQLTAKQSYVNIWLVSLPPH